MVLFLPSYTFLDSLYARWNEKGTLKRINSKKKVSYVRIPISGSSLFLTRIPLFFPGLLGTEIFLGCWSCLERLYLGDWRASGEISNRQTSSCGFNSWLLAYLSSLIDFDGRTMRHLELYYWQWSEPSYQRESIFPTSWLEQSSWLECPSRTLKVQNWLSVWGETDRYHRLTLEKISDTIFILSSPGTWGNWRRRTQVRKATRTQ